MCGIALILGPRPDREAFGQMLAALAVELLARRLTDGAGSEVVLPRPGWPCGTAPPRVTPSVQAPGTISAQTTLAARASGAVPCGWRAG